MILLNGKYKRPAACLLAAAAGLAGSLGFAPYGLWPATLAALFVFCLCLAAEPRPSRSALVAFIFFFCFHVSSLWWLNAVMTGYGEMSAPLSFAALALLCGYLSLFPALAAFCAHRLCLRLPFVRNAVLAPALTTLAEILNSRLFTGFGWDMLGYTQIDSFFAGYAPVLGVQGMSLAALAAAALLALALAGRKPVYAALAVLIALAGAALRNVEYTKPENPVRAALVQGNISTSLHWDPDQVWNEINVYYGEMIKNLDAELMVWPESAVPDLENSMEKLKVISNLDRFARDNGIGLITGIQYYDEELGRFYNSMIGIGVIDRAGTRVYRFGEGNRYYKRHLVPVGEFVPFEWVLRRFGPLFNMPMSSFSRGSRFQTNIRVLDLDVASAICYEIVYNTELRDQVTPNTGLIVTVSNDGWFNRTNGPAQHLAIARLRALEFGRPVIRATNNGITAVIDAGGKIAAVLPENVAGTLRAEFRPARGETPFGRYGPAFVYFYIGLAVLAAIVCRIRIRKILADRPRRS